MRRFLRSAAGLSPTTVVLTLSLAATIVFALAGGAWGANYRY